jgi:hypothetical protein
MALRGRVSHQRDELGTLDSGDTDQGHSDFSRGPAHQICAKLHIRNTEPVALTADLAVEPPAPSSSMNRVSAFC